MAFWTRRTWMTLAALGGFVAVAMGAFAAHGVSDPKAQEWLRTGSTYGFMHTLATFACAPLMEIGARRARLAPAFFLSGVAIFSGTLYAMALGAPRWFGAITPIGGVLFLIGWGVLAWSARDIDR
ncbi:MAG: DUF423 domain-containing protein [Phenylobacterium sp.]|uniref:DUF423 domain-containing protein n=1 Tax=Phenylobacterium sp. TaxID=1871053 RepID=UPI001A19943A|nr:DUF423 domain-containing protein [Phenylobacterium sp.]MBJ7411989.1 DUF423 domain-containing protein [Phenylobacterium sp.]